MSQDMPAFVDEHRITIAAPRDRVWTALRRYADSMGIGRRNPLAWLLGTVPRSGFEIALEVPAVRLDLTGRHRFSRYQLVFELTDAGNGETQVGARTYADFPGPHGRVYRALVIGSRAHVVAVRAMLRSICRSSLT